MQAIFEDEDERSNNESTSTVGVIIHIERISRCVEEESARRFGNIEGRI